MGTPLSGKILPSSTFKHLFRWVFKLVSGCSQVHRSQPSLPPVQTLQKTQRQHFPVHGLGNLRQIPIPTSWSKKTLIFKRSNWFKIISICVILKIFLHRYPYYIFVQCVLLSNRVIHIIVAKASFIPFQSSSKSLVVDETKLIRINSNLLEVCKNRFGNSN